MARKVDTSRYQFAYLLYMSGELQKDICERAPTTNKTLQAWIKAGGWELRRAGFNVTRSELVNKVLMTIGKTLDKALSDDEEDKNFSAISDQLVKLGNVIEKLDKKNTVVDDMEVFTMFNKWLQQRMNIDKEMKPEMVKVINRYQDVYINDRIAQSNQ